MYPNNLLLFTVFRCIQLGKHLHKVAQVDQAQDMKRSGCPTLSNLGNSKVHAIYDDINDMPFTTQLSAQIAEW